MTGPTKKPKCSAKRLGEGSKYSRSDVLRLKEVFEKHDLDHDGHVTVLELLSCLEKERSRIVDQALSAFRSVDIDKNCVLTFNEYLRRIFPYANDREFKVMLGWATPNVPPPAEPLFEPNSAEIFEIQKMFDRYDTNRNGVIDIQELIAMSEAFGYDKEEMTDLFMKTDKNMNGSISFHEFVELMKVSYI